MLVSTANLLRKRLEAIVAIVTLALWQLRQVWRFFSLVALGMLAAVVLVCSLPLFSLVNTTASVRSTFNNGLFDPTSYVQASTTTSATSAAQIQRASQQVTRRYQQLDGHLFQPPVFSMRTLESGIFQDGTPLPDQLLQLHSYDNAHIASHLTLLQGHLPQSDQKTLEIALSAMTAQQIHAFLGEQYTLYTAAPDSDPVPFLVTVVGIFQDVSFYDPFWHSDALVPIYDSVNRIEHDSAIVNNAAFLTFIDQMHQAYLTHPVGLPLTINWFLPLNTQALTSANLDQLQQQINLLANKLPLFVAQAPYIDKVVVTNTDLLTLIQAAHDQVSSFQVPLFLLVGLLLSLILFFTSLMTELLVTRQAEAIALTHIRGASPEQTFLTFVTQGLLLGSATLLLSPFIILPVVHALIQILLPGVDQGALNALPATPWAVFRLLGGYLLGATAIAVITMCLATWRTLTSSTLGRGATAAQRPFWQRYYLDVLLLVLGLLTYGFANYLGTTGIVSAELQILLAGPGVLLAATLLSLAGVLLYLRCFPWLLRGAAGLAVHARGITPLLSLELMARTPRQALRMILLLILTLAFASFSLTFVATQMQRTYDLANYRAGADFRGSLEPDNPAQGQLQAQYQQIPGVVSASVGYNDSFSFASTPDFIQVLAVDPHSFASSVIWSQEGTGQQTAAIQQMVGGLANERASFTDPFPGTPLPALPAIVNSATRDSLHLSPGKKFYLASMGETLAFIDVGEVQHLPGLNDALDYKDGLLVDYPSFVSAFTQAIPNANVNFNPNYVWLHTSSDPALHATIKRTLSNGPLALQSPSDRQELLTQLQHDPLYLNLLCTLTLGVFLALLLALIGTIVSVWLAVRGRLRSLAVLRAMGTSIGQLRSLLGWEQGIIYASAILPGLLIGLLFTLLTLPSLVFSGLAQTGSLSSSYTSAIYALQLTPPLQIVLPPSLFLALATVIGLCILSSLLMVYSASRPSLAQILRLSEDYVEEGFLFAERTQKAPAEMLKRLFSGRIAQETPLVTSEDTQKRRPTRSLGSIAGHWPRVPLRSSGSSQVLLCLGILVAMVLVCAVPLFSQVATTASLRVSLSNANNRYISSSAFPVNTNPPVKPLAEVLRTRATIEDTLQRTFLRDDKAFFEGPAALSLQGAIETTASYNSRLPLAAPPFSFASLSQASLLTRIQLTQGHLPGTGPTLQVLLTREAAAYLHVGVGDMLTQKMGYPLPMQVAGLFQPRLPGDGLLPTNYFFLAHTDHGLTGYVTALTSTEALLHIGTLLVQQEQKQGYLFEGNIFWSYRLSTQQVTFDQVHTMLNTFSKLEQDGLISTNNLPINELQQFQERVRIANVPIATTTALTLGLILLFLALMAELLVERESATIAILRSRGATRRQIFGIFFTRVLLLGSAGLLPGLLLVLPTVLLLAHFTLALGDQRATSVITNQPLQQLLHVSPYILGSMAVILATLGIALYRASNVDSLKLRRASARSTEPPVWQRFYLDIAGLIIASGAYGFSLYLTNSGMLNPQVNVQVKAPLVLIATISFILACVLVFLRIFPWLLRVSTALALRQRGVAPMLALSHMARVPRQNLRVILLLATTTAFLVFVLIFGASQEQHISDVAHYYSGADFSGTLLHPVDDAQLSTLQQRYQHLPGVTSVAIGYVNTSSQELDTTSVNTTLLAVDPASFLRTVNWPDEGSPQQQDRLIQQLDAQRASLQKLAQGPLHYTLLEQIKVPALVDAHTWNTLQLAPGEIFQLEGPFAYVAIGKVSYIPGTNDNGQTSDVSGQQSATVLVDYQSYTTATFTAGRIMTLDSAEQANVSHLRSNYVWLDSHQDASTLAGIRKSLNQGTLQLAPLADRQETIQSLENDPLSLELNGHLTLAALASLLLAWIGCLVASWMNANQRAVLFSVLRALGSTRQQLRHILTWEQILAYGAALLLGTLLGLLAALMALPSLVLTSTLPSNSNLDLFSLQNTPPVQIVLPPYSSLLLALFVLLIASSILLMSHLHGRVVLAQSLRLNED